ncbi:MAG: hypothetical protein ACW99L_06120, partial [Promethearchaeota archaeon]
MGEDSSTEEDVSKIKDDISAINLIAFIAVLILCQESVASFLVANIDVFNILFGIVALILAIVIFISLAFIDLSPVKIPYKWWLMLIFGIILVALAFFTSGVTTFSGWKPYLGGVLVLAAALVEILSDKKNIVASKFMAIVGAGFALYECINIFILYQGVTAATIINPIFGIIFAIILIIIVLDLIDIKIPYTWWVVLTIAFVIFIYVSPLYAGIAGVVLMISFI